MPHMIRFLEVSGADFSKKMDLEYTPALYPHLGMLMSLLRGRRATLLKAILTPTATTSVKEITPPIT